MTSTETKKRGRIPGKEPASTAYRAPALEKGLDILELLAGQTDGITLSQIAQKLNRSVQEVYRVVLSLEWRGYVTRGADDTFRLSMKLFDLASNNLPAKRLLQYAPPMLENLAMSVEQIVIVSVVDGWSMRVVVVAENPAPIGFRVRLGAHRPLLKSASGRTLLAFQPDAYRQRFTAELSEASTEKREDPDRYFAAIEKIRRRGYEIVSNETLRGITDVSFPVLDANDVAHAALTMPYLVWVENAVNITDAAQRLYECASALSKEIGGHLPPPDFSDLKSVARK